MLILLSAFRRTDLQMQRSRLLTGPIPTLTLTSTQLQRTGRGVSTLHYNRPSSPDGNVYYLRKANESLQLIGCELTHNRQEALLVQVAYRVLIGKLNSIPRRSHRCDCLQ